MGRAPLLLVLLVFLVGACVRVPRDALEIRRYAIDLPAAPESTETVPGLTVLVRPLQTGGTQKADRMMYREAAHRMDYYFYHRWIAPPSRMVGDALVSYLTEWSLFGGGVVRPTDGVIPTHEILCRLENLLGDNSGDGATTKLEVTLTIMRFSGGDVGEELLFQKTYTIVRDRKDRRITSYVGAANEAVGEWLDQVRVDIEPLFREEAVLR
jgi:ABC-type uncharacterized transport system auxiliary subunit